MNLYKYRIKEGTFVSAKQIFTEINFHLTDASRLKLTGSNLINFVEGLSAHAFLDVDEQCAASAGISLTQLGQIHIKIGHSN